MKKAAPNPDPKLVHRRLLARIRDATLPKDADKFPRQELEAAGILDGYNQQGMGEKTFRLFVLLATQTKELRKECERLRGEVELHQNYYSPIRDKAWAECCPIKRAELERLADADEVQVNEQRRKAREPATWLLNYGKGSQIRSWKYRDKRRFLVPFKEVPWHEPMTVMDYHAATGLSRRTIQNLVDRLAARPVVARNRRNEPARYDLETNYAVLRDWLTRYVKDKDRQKALIVRSLIYCQHKTPEHFDRLFDTLHPIIQELGVTRGEFVRYFKDCRKILVPPEIPNLWLDANRSLYELLSFTQTDSSS